MHEKQTSLAAVADAMKPLARNFERAYGGLADAFGLAGSRELLQALLDVAASTLAQSQAQAEYVGHVAAGMSRGQQALQAQLGEMAQRGEAVDSVKALVRLWARVCDAAMHDAMQTPGALEASTRLLRASTRSRREQQRVVAIASEALNIPTRAEVDEAYREIQELKRELRRLRKPPEPVAASPRATKKASPTTRRKPPRA